MRKYQSCETHEVVTPEGHKAIQNELHKVGKVSMNDVDSKQREDIFRKLDIDGK